MARAFAGKTVEKQRKEFMSWGIMGDWQNPYLTMSKDYVKNQVREDLDNFTLWLSHPSGSASKLLDHVRERFHISKIHARLLVSGLEDSACGVRVGIQQGA
jgi:hypothetical protein